MHRLNKLAFANVWQFCCDIFFLFLSFMAAYLFISKMELLFPAQDYLWVLIVYIPFWAFSMSAMGMYNKTTFNYIDRIFRNVLVSTLFSGVIVTALFYMMKRTIFNRKLFITLLIFTILLILSERYLFLFLLNKFRSISDKNVLIIGTQPLIDKFEYYINKTQISMNIAGYLKLDEKPVSDPDSISRLEILPELLKDNIIDEVILAIPREYVFKVEKYILLCEEMGITVRVLLDLYNLRISKTFFNYIGDIPMFTYHTVSLNSVQLVAKRVLDIIGATIGLLITAIVSIFMIPLIKLDSPGPVFFKQNRVGLNGRIFKLYKFRSMRADAEELKKELLEKNQVKDGLMFKLEKDPRVTKLGKFLRMTSIDELPQFWNVLKGDMSLVGTRPPTPDEVSKYLYGHWRRISIKPGLTGLWQISGRSSILDFNEVVRLDTCYIDKWSISEDIKIILKTIPAVLAKKGAM